MSEMNFIEGLLDLEDEEIKQLYNGWDKGDCSLVGITEIYLYQCIKKHKQEHGEYYDTNYDKISLRYGQTKLPSSEVIACSFYTKHKRIASKQYKFDCDGIQGMAFDIKCWNMGINNVENWCEVSNNGSIKF